MFLKSSLEKMIDNIVDSLGKSADITTRVIKKGTMQIGYVFLQSLCSDEKIGDLVNKAIIHDNSFSFESVYKNIKNSIYSANIKEEQTIEQLYTYLFNGFIIILFNNTKKFIAVEVKDCLDRGITESTSEPIVRGPKDSFTENYQKNIGLIRKRIKDTHLVFDEFIIGRRTKTKVSVSYINDIASLDSVNVLKEKLKKIDIDGILDSGYIRELIKNKSDSLFPKVISTERPDLACSSLLNGKIIVIVENTPFVLVMPAVLVDFFHSPEDDYQKPINASFSRILRFLCLFITAFTPAIYIALMTFNQEIIPDQLLISLAMQREGVPFPTAIEVLLFVLIFEILREADVHSPSFSGSAMNIVGALILGDAAVNAGLVSPIVIIIVAITSITELVFYDVDMINALREWRIIFIIFGIALGVVGIMVGQIIFITRLASMECLGVPYLSPISPLSFSALKDSIIRVNRKKLKTRPSFLTKNTRKMGYLDEENNH